MTRVRRTSFLVLTGVWLVGCEQHKPKLAQTKPPVVMVAQPTSDYITDYEDFTGRTDAEFTVTIRSRVTGYLDKVHFKDGDEVSEGAILFDVDPRPYEAELARTEATVAQSEARLARLDADFRRAKNLFTRGNIAREEYDKIAGDRAEAEAAVGIAKASRDLAKLNAGFTKIKAPISGQLSRRLADPGNLIISDETSLTTIVSLDPMFVYFEVDERTMLRFRRLIKEGKIKSRREGAILPIQVGLSDEEGFPHEGVVNYSDNKVDTNTGTLQVRGVIANPKPRVLSPGLFVRVRIPIGGSHKSLLIPEQAVGTDQGRKFLYIVNDKDEVVYRSVKVGPLNSGLRVVEEGLSPTDRVVVSGLQRVRPGVKVEAKLAESDSSKTPPIPDKVQPAAAAGKQAARPTIGDTPIPGRNFGESRF